MRRPSDIAMLGIASVLALLMGLWAQTESSVNVNLFRTFNDLPANMEGLAKSIYALGSIWAVLAITGVFLLTGQVRVAWHGALAGAGAWSLAVLLNEILGTHDIHGLGVNVRIGDGPAYPVANVAAIAALAFGLAPYLVRPLRRIFAFADPPRGSRRDVPGRRLSGRCARRVLPGLRGRRPCPSRARCSGGIPSIVEVRSALTDLGYDVTSITPRTSTSPAPRLWTSSLRRASGSESTPSGATNGMPGLPPSCGTRPCITIPGRRCSGVGSSRSSTSASR